VADGHPSGSIREEGERVLGRHKSKEETIEDCVFVLRRLVELGPCTRGQIFSGTVRELAINREWQRNTLDILRDLNLVETYGLTRGISYKLVESHNYDSAISVLDVYKNRERSDGKGGVGNRFVMTESLKSFIDGIIISDGHYRVSGNPPLSSSMDISQRSDRADWIEIIRSVFEEHGIISVVTSRDGGTRLLKSGKLLNVSPSVYLRTISYRNLLSERIRWYPDGKKIVPRDLVITDPRFLANWYMGDGNVSTSTGILRIGLHTNGFIEEDAQWLSRQFDSQLSMHSAVGHWNNQPILQITHKNAAKFIDLVRPFVTKSFEYKVPLDPWQPPKCQKCGKAIEGVRRSKKTLL
jgi:LAGLIDADG DNA endonuclease family protein